MLDKLAKYNKLWVMLATMALVIANQLYGTNKVVQAVVMAAGAVGLYAIPNK